MTEDVKHITQADRLMLYISQEAKHSRSVYQFNKYITTVILGLESVEEVNLLLEELATEIHHGGVPRINIIEDTKDTILLHIFDEQENLRIRERVSHLVSRCEEYHEKLKDVRTIKEYTNDDLTNRELYSFLKNILTNMRPDVTTMSTCKECNIALEQNLVADIEVVSTSGTVLYNTYVLTEKGEKLMKEKMQEARFLDDQYADVYCGIY